MKKGVAFSKKAPAIALSFWLTSLPAVANMGRVVITNQINPATGLALNEVAELQNSLNGVLGQFLGEDYFSSGGFNHIGFFNNLGHLLSEYQRLQFENLNQAPSESIKAMALVLRAVTVTPRSPEQNILKNQLHSFAPLHEMAKRVWEQAENDSYLAQWLQDIQRETQKSEAWIRSLSPLPRMDGNTLLAEDHGHRPPVPVPELGQLKKEFFNRILSFTPELGTHLGVRDSYSKLSDLSATSIQEHIAYLESVEEQLSTLAPSLKQLDPQDRIDHPVMVSIVKNQLHSWRDRKEYQKEIMAVVNPLRYIHQQIGQIQRRAGASKEWEDVRVRTEKTPIYLKQVENNIRQGLRDGHIPAKRLVEKAIQASKDAAKFFEVSLIDGAKESLGSSEFTQIGDRLHQAAVKARGAYLSQSFFLEKEMLPFAKEENDTLGEKEYAWRLKHIFGIQDSPLELYHRGLELAARIREQMEKLASQIDPTKELSEVMEDLSKEHPPNDQKLMESYTHLIERARKFVVKKKLFNLPSNFELDIAQTPPSLSAMFSIAMFNPAPIFDPNKKGTFLVTPTNGDEQMLAKHNFSLIPSIAVHEGIPGHGFQYFYLQRLMSIAPVRYLLLGDMYYGLNIEGYAGYIEELMRQHGFFSPREELAQLGAQLSRAYFIVVETALHIGKMSFEEAAKTFHEQAFFSRALALEQVDWLARLPILPITYMLGRLQIEKLKEEYRKVKGKDFNEAQFHEDFLSFGPVPPSMMAPVLLEKARQEKFSGKRLRRGG